MTHYADLEQLFGLVLNALRRVNYHYRRVCRHQCTVGILGEVLVSGSVENINAISVVLKLKHRRGYGDTSLLLNLHPVRHSVLGCSLSLYRTGKINSSAVQKELFGKSCLTCVRMRDNRERSSLVNLFS